MTEDMSRGADRRTRRGYVGLWSYSVALAFGGATDGTRSRSVSDPDPEPASSDCGQRLRVRRRRSLVSRGLRASRRSATRREQDLYYSLRLRVRANQAWGRCMFSLTGEVAVRQCLPLAPRSAEPYDFAQQTGAEHQLRILVGRRADAATRIPHLRRGTDRLQDEIGRSMVWPVSIFPQLGHHEMPIAGRSTSADRRVWNAWLPSEGTA